MAAAALLVVALGGCESAPRAAALDKAIASYQEGQFTTAYEGATRVAQQDAGPQRDRANYVAGLCAFRMDNMDEAEMRFRIASASQDREIAARARAMLGVMRLDQGRHLESARLLEEAATDLEAADAREARRRAAIAYERAGLHGEATRVARATQGSAGPRAASGWALFTLQAGAFQERRRADRAAREVRTAARGRDLGEVRVVPGEDDMGRKLFLVQVGTFSSRQEAARVRAQLGKLEYIVTALEGP